MALLLSGCAIEQVGEPVTATIEESVDASADDERVETTSTTEAEVAEPSPSHGGTLVYAVDEDVEAPWTAYDGACGATCGLVLRNITETLFVLDDAGAAVPYLLDSVTANEDSTVWELVVRRGVRFHDGTPLNADSVKYNLNVARSSLVTGPEMAPIEGIDAAGRVVTVRMKQPWASFPGVLTGRAGMMFSVEWLQPLETNPRRRVAAEAYHHPTKLTEPTSDPAAPMGLGPFRLAAYEPGDGGSVELVRNKDYWRGDSPLSTAEDLPYLDGVTLSFIADRDDRRSALTDDDVHMMRAADDAQAGELLDQADELNLIAGPAFAATSQLVMNLAADDLDGDEVNAASPLLDARVRRALAHTLDRERLADEFSGGGAVAANGPFPIGVRGSLAESGYPPFSPVDANVLIDEYLADARSDRLTFSLLVTTDPRDRELGRAVRAMWRETFGSRVVVELTELEPEEFVDRVTRGDFMMASWSVPSTAEVDERRVWWGGDAALAIGQPAVNVGRLSDPTIDQLLLVSRTSSDPDERRAAAEAVNRRQAELLPALTLTWDTHVSAASPTVRDLTVSDLPAGGRAMPLVAGVHALHHVWCWEGDCG